MLRYFLKSFILVKIIVFLAFDYEDELNMQCKYLLDNGYCCKKDVVVNSHFCSEHIQCKYLLNNGLTCNKHVIGESYFCPKHSRSSPDDVEIFKAINESLLQDLREYWTRSNFYLVVQAALLSGFGLLISNASKTPPSPSFKPLEITICFLGLIIAILWFWVAFSSLKWIRKWRIQMIRIDKIIDRRQYHTPAISDAMNRWSMIPTRITLFLPTAFGSAWICFLILIWLIL